LFSSWTEEKAPTCTETGTEARTCSVCGYRQTRKISALGHTLVEHQAVAVTCTTPGSIRYWECTREGCGRLFSDAEGTTETSLAAVTIPAKGHSYSTDWSSDEENHWHECAACGSRKDQAVHKWGAGTVSGNKKTYTCTVCGKTKDVDLYTVKFDTGGESTIADQTVESGGKASQPADPTRTGYTFGGWYTGSGCDNAYDFDTAMVGAKTTKYRAKKSLLPKKHAACYRFLSTNTNVAAVNGQGRVTAKRPGTCRICIYAQNGVRTTVQVTVKQETIPGPLPGKSTSR
jgi:uncharacterized repeat protein (TIGR02543 family)